MRDVSMRDVSTSSVLKEWHIQEWVDKKDLNESYDDESLSNIINEACSLHFLRHQLRRYASSDLVNDTWVHSRTYQSYTSLLRNLTHLARHSPLLRRIRDYCDFIQREGSRMDEGVLPDLALQEPVRSCVHADAVAVGAQGKMVKSGLGALSLGVTPDGGEVCTPVCLLGQYQTPAMCSYPASPHKVSFFCMSQDGAVVVIPIGRTLFVCSSSGDQLLRWELAHEIYLVHFVVDAEVVLCCCDEFDGVDVPPRLVNIWTGETVRTFFSIPDDDFELTASFETCLLVEGRHVEWWSTISQVRTRTTLVHDNPVWVCSADQVGNWLAAGTLAGKVALWNARTGEAGLVIQTPCSEIDGVWMHPLGSRVVSYSNDDCVLRVWDTATGRLLCMSEAVAAVDMVCFGPRNQMLVGVASQPPRLWDGNRWSEVLPFSAECLVFGLSSGTLLCKAGKKSSVYRWEFGRDIEIGVTPIVPPQEILYGEKSYQLMDGL
eukprot:Rmarinus@m.1516